MVHMNVALKFLKQIRFIRFQLLCALPRNLSLLTFHHIYWVSGWRKSLGFKGSQITIQFKSMLFFSIAQWGGLQFDKPVSRINVGAEISG